MLFSHALLAISCLSLTLAQPTSLPHADAVAIEATPLNSNPFSTSYSAGDSMVAPATEERSMSAVQRYREVIRSRQANKKDILHRATRRLTAPRAYVSGTACGGFAGQTFVLERSSTSYIGGDSLGRINLGHSLSTAVRVTLSSTCQLLDRSGYVVGTSSDSPDPSDLSFAPSQNPNYYALTCRGDENRQLSCTRFGSKTPGVFCAGSAADSAYVSFGDTCEGQYATVSLLLTDA